MYVCMYIKYMTGEHIVKIKFLNEPQLILFRTVKRF